MRYELIELFKQLNAAFDPGVNPETGNPMRHALSFDTKTEELFLAVAHNGKQFVFELDYIDLEDPFYLLIKRIRDFIDDVE